MPECPWLSALDVQCAIDFAGHAPGYVAERLNAMPHRGRLVGLPVFEPPQATLSALEYERCVASGAVPTRDLLHDWYNGVVWLACPKSKSFINQSHLRHAPLSGSSTAGNGRTRLRDALTLMDESGALMLTTNPARACALVQHDWTSLFLNDRSAWSADTAVFVFGHGLLESMHKPHKGLCAKALPVVVGNLAAALRQKDELLLQVLKQLCHPAQFSPLPVMGVPGWFAASEGEGFYNDAQVFRAKPTARSDSIPERLAFVWDGATLLVGKCAGQSLLAWQGEESPDSSEHSAG